MKTNKYILLLSLGLALASCNNEAPFESGVNSGEGQLDLSSINLQIKVDESIKVKSRASNEDLLPDFEVYILNSSGQSQVHYKYKEMPQLVTLPAGSYKIQAVYGEDVDAKWENPYFVGQSKSFEIKANQINKNIDPVECELKNVMVSILFDKELLDHISGSPQVEVYVNKNNSLTFTKDHSDKATPGYFKHDDVNTLTATFKGVVDGTLLTEVKTLNDINPGNHYRLTFYRHEYKGDEFGYVEGNVMIDASVTVNNVAGNVTVGEESILTDVTWPSEDGDDPGEDPGDNGDDNPGENDDPALPGEGPKISLDPSATVEFGKVNNVSADDIVIMNIHSDSGLTKFQVEIVSETLHLTDVGASSNTIDLIEPGDMLETWQSLNLLQNGETTLRGKKDVVFDICQFMGMLVAVKGEHHFVLEIGDDNGTSSETLILNVP